MSPVVTHFISSYLLLPILTVILAVVACIIAKKNQMLNNKKLIFYVLLNGILLGLPGLTGCLNYNFMPYAYLLLSFIYLIIGFYTQSLQLKYLTGGKKSLSFRFTFFLSLVVMLLGCGLFSLIFNLTNELQYGIWASTCLFPFLFPLLYRKAVACYFDIPIEIYKTWQYSDEYDSDDFRINMERITVADLEIFRNVTDLSSERITGKVSEDSVFGQWFQRMIDDCNRKSPNTPIVYRDDNGKYYEWIFYIKPSFFKRRIYIDPDETFAHNNLKRGCVIIAKRVISEYSSDNEF
jgi:uncharacterized membrane protein